MSMRCESSRHLRAGICIRHAGKALVQQAQAHQRCVRAAARRKELYRVLCWSQRRCQRVACIRPYVAHFPHPET